MTESSRGGGKSLFFFFFLSLLYCMVTEFNQLELGDGGGETPAAFISKVYSL